MTPHHILLYTYVDGMVDRRGPYREAHLALIADAKESGGMLMAGALGDPVSGGLFVFSGPGPEPAERFAAADPYVEAGLVTARRIETWNVV
jgi:uncharacterized protein YciI